MPASARAEIRLGARTLRLAVLLHAALWLGGALHAHEDPLGDTHPHVIVAGDHFEVYFRNNSQAGLLGSDPVYRTTFSTAGALLAKRDPFTGTEPTGPFTLMLPFEHEQPILQFTPNGQTQPVTIRPRLPAGQNGDCCLLSWPIKERMVVRASSPQPPLPDRAWPFLLYVVEVPSGEVLASAVVGPPARIYNFACTSPVIEAGEELLVAWMETKLLSEKQEPLSNGTSATVITTAERMVLTRWNPATGRVLHTVLAQAMDGNVAISLGRIGQTVLVAWHELGAIRTRTVDLQTTAFVPSLPELTTDFTSEDTLKEILANRFSK